MNDRAAPPVLLPPQPVEGRVVASLWPFFLFLLTLAACVLLVAGYMIADYGEEWETNAFVALLLCFVAGIAILVGAVRTQKRSRHRLRWLNLLGLGGICMLGFAMFMLVFAIGFGAGTYQYQHKGTAMNGSACKDNKVTVSWSVDTPDVAAVNFAPRPNEPSADLDYVVLDDEWLKVPPRPDVAPGATISYQVPLNGTVLEKGAISFLYTYPTGPADADGSSWHSGILLHCQNDVEWT